jgi:hypothetical protein
VHYFDLLQAANQVLLHLSLRFVGSNDNFDGFFQRFFERKDPHEGSSLAQVGGNSLTAGILRVVGGKFRLGSIICWCGQPFTLTDFRLIIYAAAYFLADCGTKLAAC